MKYIHIALVIILVAVSAYLVLWKEATPRAESLPQFSDYPVEREYEGLPVGVDFNTNPPAAQYLSAITEGVREQGVNFAGKYTVVSWGCGTSCQSSAIIDAETGAIVIFGLMSSHGLSFEKDSRLLIVNPKENFSQSEIESVVSDYYVMENGELRPLGKYSVITGERQACIQVMVLGRNPLTREEREFPTPCDLPFGWESLETGQEVIE
jgi:hypothetical protein